MRSPEGRSDLPKQSSEKGGPFSKGTSSRRQGFDLHSPNIPYVPPHSQDQYRNRRFMMRDPNSGKGKSR